MYSTGGGPRAEKQPTTRSRLCRVGVVEHYTCGVAALLVTAVTVALGYSTLAAVSELLGILGSTWLVLSVFGGWVVTWLLLEVVWEWRAGRLRVGE